MRARQNSEFPTISVLDGHVLPPIRYYYGRTRRGRMGQHFGVRPTETSGLLLDERRTSMLNRSTTRWRLIAKQQPTGWTVAVNSRSKSPTKAMPRFARWLLGILNNSQTNTTAGGSRGNCLLLTNAIGDL